MEHIKNKKDKSHYDKIKKLLDFILTEKGNIENAIAWSKLEELESAYNNWDKNNIIVI